MLLEKELDCGLNELVAGSLVFIPYFARVEYNDRERVGFFFGGSLIEGSFGVTAASRR